jgi:hypothetical protein
VERLPSDIDNLLGRPNEIGSIPPLWDGKASGRIVDSVLAHS